mgnify:CR=1 FL=1
MTEDQEHLLGLAMAKLAKKDGHVASLPKGDNKRSRREIALKDARYAKRVYDIIRAAPKAIRTTDIQHRLAYRPGGTIPHDGVVRALKQLKDLGKINSGARAGVVYHEIPFKTPELGISTPTQTTHETTRTRG